MQQHICIFGAGSIGCYVGGRMAAAGCPVTLIGRERLRKEAPTWLFRLLANKMLAIDPLARSSMWEDLEAGRITEVDWLNGEIVRLAEKMGHHAPVNARLIALIREAEASRKRRWSGEDLLTELKQAAASSSLALIRAATSSRSISACKKS